MSMHAFDPCVAAKVGLPAAVIYQNIFFWTEKNFANGKHIHDGKVWTYNSVKAFEMLFPYLTAKQIRSALEKLAECCLIYEGNYNASPYDRTKWYGLSCEIHLPKKANETAQKGEPIPDSKPDISTDTITSPDQQISSERSGTSSSEHDKTAPKARLPECWALSDEGWAYARSQGIPDGVIEDEARGFHAYWSDRSDREARKSSRGWEQCWAGWCRRISSRYRQNAGVPGNAPPGGSGPGRSMASIAAWRRATGAV